MGKVERWGSEFSGKHRCILFLLSLFHPVVLFSSPLTVVAPSSPLLLPFFPSFLFSFFFFFFCIVPLPSPAPSTSVGVNLSPRLSPNPELYKLKPISLPGLRSSYSKPLYFRLFVVGKHARSSSRRSARTRCLATTLHLLLVHPHTRTLSPSLSLSLSRSSCVLIPYTRTCSNEFVFEFRARVPAHTHRLVFIMHDSLRLRIFNTTMRTHALDPRTRANFHPIVGRTEITRTQCQREGSR